VSCANTPGVSNAVFWVGIDGYANSHLIQGGLSASCASTSSTAKYAIWQETNPTVPAKNVASVAVGDNIQTTVSYAKATSKYTIKIVVNGTTRLNKTGKLSGEPLASAECTAEAPRLRGSGQISALANFGTFHMASCQVATATHPNAISILDGPQDGLAVHRQDLVRSGAHRASTGLPFNASWPVTWNAP